MMRGNTNEFSAAKRSTFNMSSGDQRKAFTAGNQSKSGANLPPTHPKGLGATSTI